MPKQLACRFSWGISMWPMPAFVSFGLDWYFSCSLVEHESKCWFAKISFERSVISFQTPVIKGSSELQWTVQDSRLGGIQRCAWEKELSGVWCEAQTGNHARPSLCDLLPPMVNPKSWKTLFVTSHLSNTKPFCVSKYLRVHITQSWKCKVQSA